MASFDSIPKQRQIKLISQGSYGCIIKPSLKCSGKIGADKYITKIQKKKATSERESEIGKRIQQIPNYSLYFSPVLETCDIKMGTVDLNEIKKCEFMHNDNNNTYSSNKIKYVGKYTLVDYLLGIFQKHPKIFFREMLRTYKDLLTSIGKLNHAGIIHFDLKENNIICSDKNGNPILIDFGLSLTQEIMDNQKRSGFFVYGPDYSAWCFDICLISYVVQYHKESDIFMESISKKLVDDYFLENTGMKQLFIKEELTTYKTNLTVFLQQFYEKTMKEVLDVFYKYKNSWDNYSIGIIYLTIWKTMDIPPSPIIDKFMDFLKSIILSMPDKRFDAKQTSALLENSFTSVPKVENRKLLQVLDSESKDNLKNEKRRDNITKSILSELKKEAIIERRL